MQKKVLIVDDSALMRRVLSDIIDSDNQFAVEDTASNGLNALDLLLAGKQYDIILCDIKMGKMDGVEFLREMNKNNIHIPVLIVSSIASESASETIEALALGAFDFVKKPNGTADFSFSDFAEKILSRIHCVFDSDSHKEEKKIAPIEKKQPKPVSLDRAGGKSNVKKKKGNHLLVIASSTGGPKALHNVIPLFPKEFPYPVVLVQHMPKGFTMSLAKRLDETSPIRVKEAEDGEKLKPGTVYIAAGGKQCELIEKDGNYYLSENDKPPRGGLKPCADIFFESLVNTSIDKVYCVVLTGMGADATEGIRLTTESKETYVVAQNRETCVVYGMPRAVEQAGLVDEMVPLEEVTRTILNKIGV